MISCSPNACHVTIRFPNTLHCAAWGKMIPGCTNALQTAKPKSGWEVGSCPPAEPNRFTTCKFFITHKTYNGPNNYTYLFWFYSLRLHSRCSRHIIPSSSRQLCFQIYKPTVHYLARVRLYLRIKDKLGDIVEHLAAKESDIFLRSWWTSKLTLNANVSP